MSDADSPRILLVRLSAIGDVIQTLPVASALRQRFPGGFLAWLVEGRSGDLLDGHSAVDEVIRLPRGWLKSPRIVWNLRRRLRGLRFDIAIDAQGLTKSAVAAWLSGSRRRIGFAGEKGRELSTWLNNQRVLTTGPHTVEHNLQLLRPLGIESPEVRFDLPETPADARAAEAICRLSLRESGAALAERKATNDFALINPGAGWPSKLWPTARFAAVARHLFERWNLPTLVVWAGPQERAMAEEIIAAADGAAQLTPPTTLTELAALARRCRLFVASDTGPLHLAAAVGAACVGLYGPWPAERHGPYGAQNIALQKMVFEGPTRARRTAPPIYMQAIDVAAVCEACDRVLTRPTSARPHRDRDSSRDRCTS